ncbi:MAG: dynamin family protein, partial [Comamonas sp.]
AFENLLANGIMGQRQQVLQAAMKTSVAQLQTQVERVINMRRSDLDDQLAELCSLRGKNVNVIAGMRGRIEAEQKEFDQSTSKILAMRAVHMRMLKELFELLSSGSLKSELEELKAALEQRGLKLGARKVYEQTFERLHALAAKALAQAEEIHTMLSSTFKELNAEYGFSLQVPPQLVLPEFADDLRSIEASYTQYLGLSSAIKLSSAAFAQRLIKALALRLRTVFEAASNDVDMWSKSLTAPVDAQLRERKRSYTRRLEAVDRISGAATGLEERITEMEGAQVRLGMLQSQLTSATGQLLLPQVSEKQTSSVVLDINLVA